MIDREISVRMPAATSCRPVGALASLRLRALGDGPAGPGSIVEISPDQPLRTLPELAFPILAVHAAAEAPGWSGVGWRPLAAAGSELTLLPPRLSCPLADPEVRLPEAGATAVLADGTLLIAGGLDEDGFAIGRVALLAPGAQLAALATSGLALPSAHATATALPDGRVLVAGGTIAESAPSYEQLEILEPRADAARVIEPLAQRRREHGAMLLRDGRVLLAGGRASEGGAPLATLELVDPRARTSALLSATLASPRVRPLLATSEDGRVWIAGGDEGAGVLVIERFDPDSQSIESWDALGDLPTPIALAPLAGDRLAWIGATTAHVVLLGEDGPRAIAPMPGLVVPALDEGRAAATAGGGVIVVGQRGGVRAAYLWDPSSGRVEAREATRVPSAIVPMIDGSVIELSAAGGSMRREREPTPHDDPPSALLFGADDEWWLRDPTGADRWATPRWETSRTELVAREAGARVDLRAVRGTRWSVVLRASGSVEVLLIPEGTAPVVIAIEDGSVAVGDCRVARAAGAAIALSIDAGRARIGAGADERDCETGVTGRVGLAFRAREAGATLSGADVARR